LKTLPLISGLFRHEETNVATFLDRLGAWGLSKSSCITFLLPPRLGEEAALIFDEMIVLLNLSSIVGVYLNKLAENRICEILVTETSTVMVKREEVLRKPFAETFSSVPLTPVKRR
jgi:hypothetical protein